MKSIMNFLFGKMPNIFSQKGEVGHTRRSSAWTDWKKRYAEGFEYNWKRHSGMRTKPLKKTQ